MIGDENKKKTYKWGDESALKFDLAKRLTVGSTRGYGGHSFPQQKTVVVICGDNEQQALVDIEYALNNKLPMVVLEGSTLCDHIANLWNKK